MALDNPFPNPASEWLSEKSWSEVVRASNLKGLEQFKDSVTAEPNEWKAFYDVFNPHDIPCPSPFHEIKGLGRLVIIKCIRPDKVVPAVQVKVLEILRFIS